jgi:hypothetical protein
MLGPRWHEFYLRGHLVRQCLRLHRGALKGLSVNRKLNFKVQLFFLKYNENVQVGGFTSAYLRHPGHLRVKPGSDADYCDTSIKFRQVRL